MIIKIQNIFTKHKMRNLGDMNDLYNAQDVILLCEIIENHFQAMNNTYGYNPRKCNSASSMSSCIEREMSRIILALPTKLENVEIFEETVTGCFSLLNTWLAFDTQILLPNLKYKDNFLIKDEIGHLYMVDTIFDSKKLKNNWFYNEIYQPIIERKKIINPCERYVLQLLEQYKEKDNDNPVAYRATRKAHATMLKKKFILLYWEHLAFVIKRVGWKVIKIHAHLTFKQKWFKKDFIFMNQKSRQE